MKNYIIIFIVIVLVAVGLYFLIQTLPANQPITQDQDEMVDGDQTNTGDLTNSGEGTGENDLGQTVIGNSVDGRPIIAYHYGDGRTELLFVGGIHGGYSWNTALVAYELIDYLETNPESVPENIKVTVIPVLNPDGLNEVVGTTSRFTSAQVSGDTISGRFNGNKVDLNRNFDCDWQSTGKWQNRDVDGGTAAFSEPEAQAVKNYIESRDLQAVVVWYSSAGGVFASSCHNGVLDETRTLTNLYAEASGYSAYEEFDFYEITGDMVNWLAKKEIPAISVLLTNHQDVEWAKNRSGVQALLNHYAE